MLMAKKLKLKLKLNVEKAKAQAAAYLLKHPEDRDLIERSLVAFEEKAAEL